MPRLSDINRFSLQVSLTSSTALNISTFFCVNYLHRLFSLHQEPHLIFPESLGVPLCPGDREEGYGSAGGAVGTGWTFLPQFLHCDADLTQQQRR